MCHLRETVQLEEGGRSVTKSMAMWDQGALVTGKGSHLLFGATIYYIHRWITVMGDKIEASADYWVPDEFRGVSPGEFLFPMRLTD